MSFRSKIDVFMIVIGVIGVFTLTVCLFGVMLSEESLSFKVFLSSVFSIAILYLILMFANTRYIVTKHCLIIWDSFIKRTISIQDINKINNNADLISSPALSLDRIEIIHHQTKKIYISPKNKIEFVNTLKSHNEKIIVDESLETLN